MEVKSNKITFSDPCYDLDTWCMIKDIPFPNGKYETVVKTKSNDNLEIKIYNEKLTQYDRDQIIWKGIEGIVGVDSGQAGIFDANYYTQNHSCKPNKYGKCINEEWYRRICDITLDHENGCAGEIDNLGAVSSSGWGDGSYPAYLGELYGEVVAAKIVFIEEKKRR